MANLKGIDVSKHNGVIDWNAAKQPGEVDFAILRAGCRWEDEDLDENLY